MAVGRRPGAPGRLPPLRIEVVETDLGNVLRLHDGQLVKIPKGGTLELAASPDADNFLLDLRGPDKAVLRKLTIKRAT